MARVLRGPIKACVGKPPLKNVWIEGWAMLNGQPSFPKLKYTIFLG